MLIGGDTGELDPATAGTPSTQALRGLTERMLPVRLGRVQSTLLGPEGTTVRLCSWGFGVGLWVVGWLLVENCTVDASILFFVVKLSRANGGCLGTRSR